MTNNRKMTRKEMTYEYIKQKIIDCEYGPGAFINAEQLCKEMGNVSRTPVREALSLLEQEGLVTVLPQKGNIVTGVNIQDINRVFEVRMLLETYAISQYGENIDQGRLKIIYENIKKELSNFSTLKEFYELDDNLHDAIITALPNPYLVSTYEKIRNLNKRFRVLTGNQSQRRIRATQQEHINIIEACFRKDWKVALENMKLHQESSREATILLIANNSHLL